MTAAPLALAWIALLYALAVKWSEASMLRASRDRWRASHRGLVDKWRTEDMAERDAEHARLMAADK